MYIFWMSPFTVWTRNSIKSYSVSDPHDLIFVWDLLALWPSPQSIQCNVMICSSSKEDWQPCPLQDQDIVIPHRHTSTQRSSKSHIQNLFIPTTRLHTITVLGKCAIVCWLQEYLWKFEWKPNWVKKILGWNKILR